MALDGEAPTNIASPKEGIEYCNKRIRICEADAQKCREAGDFQTAAKFEGWIVQWADQLQHWVRQDWQEGGRSTDASKGVSKWSERQRRKQRFK